MDPQAIRTLNQATQDFYERVAPSFSDTRQRPWSGWERVLDMASSCIERDNAIASSIQHEGDASRLRSLDLGSGNMRFERYLEERVAEPGSEFGLSGIDAVMIDTCKFPDDPFPGKAINIDIVDMLLEGRSLMQAIDDDGFDLTVAFGLFHHIPSEELRRKLLSEMIAVTQPGGVVALSLWRPLDDERIERKAESVTEAGVKALGVRELEDGDILLGWQDVSDAFRYCHHFDDGEIAALEQYSEDAGCKVLDSFAPTNGNDRLNHYLVMKRPGKGSGGVGE